MLMNSDVESLKDWALRIRIEALTMIHKSPAGHPGGSFSVADIMSVLYFSEIDVKPADPKYADRDRVVLSKGHACAALYAALGLRGFFETAEFSRFRRLDGLLEGHPSITIPGVDAPSGSLGMGLSQGLGMALGSRYAKRDFRVYVILGDGDMQEGATWEAIMAAGFHKVDNLCVILDYNKIQQDGWVKDTMDYGPVVGKVKAFHWAVDEIDGHDCGQILRSFKKARKTTGEPFFIIAHTVKGKGVSFMENQPFWHGSVPVPADVFSRALEELNRGDQ